MTHYANGKGPDEGQNDDRNVIRIPTLAERDKLRREKEKSDRRMLATAEPMINLPSATKYLLGLIIGLFILTDLVLSPERANWVIEEFGFIPARFNDGSIDSYMLISPFSHMLLHGSWMHVTMNALMLAAFGSGVERWIGTRRMLILFIASGLFGAALHYILNAASSAPMIGASGGLSGLFAAAIVMLGRGQREMGGRWGMLPFAILWIGLSVGFGMLGGPDGSVIAWAAHVGGFLGGFLILKAMRV